MGGRAVVVGVLQAHQLLAHAEAIHHEGTAGGDVGVLLTGQYLSGGYPLEAVGRQDVQGAQSLLEQVGGPADLEHDDGIALLLIGAELAVHLVGGSGAGSHLGNSQRIQSEHDVIGSDLLTVAPVDVVPQGQGVGGTVLADVHALRQTIVQRTVGVGLPHGVIQVLEHLLAQIRGAVVVPVQGGNGFLDGVDEGTALDGLTLSIVRPAGLLAAGRKAQQHQSGEDEANDFGKLLHVFSPLVILMIMMIIMYRSPLPGDLSDEHVFLQPIHGNDDLLHGQG